MAAIDNYLKNIFNLFPGFLANSAIPYTTPAIINTKVKTISISATEKGNIPVTLLMIWAKHL